MAGNTNAMMVTLPAAASLLGKTGFAVKMTSTGVNVAGAGEACIGILQGEAPLEPTAAGMAASVQYSGIARVKLGGTVSKGDRVASDANGKLVVATPSTINQTSVRNMPLGNPTLAIDTDFDIKTTEPISYLNAGLLKTLADNFAFNTGTAATFPQGTWGAVRLSVDGAGAARVTWYTNAGAGYASEALAKAAIQSVPAGDTPIGYVTVRAHASNSFTAGTDALAGGTGGNPAQTTNYYNSIEFEAADGGSKVVGVCTKGGAADEFGEVLLTLD